MRTMAIGIAAGVLMLAMCIGQCEAKVATESVEHDDRAVVLISRPFGFMVNGVIDITVSDWKVYKDEEADVVDKARLGFFITTSEAEAQLENDLSGGGCVLDDDNLDRLFTFVDMDSGKTRDNAYIYQNRLTQEGEYSLFFANCDPNAVVSFDIKVALYNEGSNGTRDYLSAGEAPLPAVFMVMCVLYTLSSGLWFLTVWHSPKETRLKIHFLMGFLVFFKALTVFAQSGMYFWVRKTGDPEGWNIAYYVFTFMRGIFLFMVIVLIGTGWSFLKPFLADREKKVIMVVVPLQVFANVAIIILDESGPAVKGWFTWRDIFHLLDIICCCAILFPIVWSIKHLREAAGTDGKAARNVQKLTLFRQFYVLVVSYIYFTRIVVYLLRSTMPYQYVWLSDASGELATLAFYSWTGFMFRPITENPYLHLKTDELDELEAIELAKLRAEEEDEAMGK